MDRYLPWVLAVIAYYVVHDGAHALVAALFGEFEAVRWQVLGPEVIYHTPVEQRSGMHWALIAGTSSGATILLAYLLLASGGKALQIGNRFLKRWIFYLTIVLLLFDPLNLAIGPFIYGGDANGIAVGLGVSRYVIQAVFLVVLLVNRELMAQKLFPMYDVHTESPLFRPWLPAR